MSNKLNFKNIAIGGVALLWIIVGLLAVSFLICAGLTYLIFWCFGWQWSWVIAFGIWLVALFFKWLLGESHD